MKPDELIKALRGQKHERLCDVCPEKDNFDCYCDVGRGKMAADLISAMQAELSQKTQQLEAYKRTGLTPDEFKQSVDYVLELNKKCKESTGCTAEEIANIKDQLSTYKAAMQNWHEEDI